jgi:hypothetical protein
MWGRCPNRRSVLLAWWTLALCSAPIAAAEPTVHRNWSGRPLIPREQIVSRSKPQLQFLTAVDQTVGGLAGLDAATRDHMSHSVEQSAQTVGRGLLRGYLRNLVNLSGSSGLARPHALGRSGRMEFEAGIHHTLPELKMHYRLHHGALKLGVTLDGSAGVSFQKERSPSGMRLSAGYDGEDAFTVQLRFGF